MATTTVASSLSINWEDGSKTDYTLAYKPFFTTGDLVADGKGGKILAGGYVDINNQPIIDKSKPGQERQFFSDCPDGSSLISFKQATGRDFTDADKQALGVTGNPVFHVVQFEYTTRDQSLASMYGLLPSPIAILTLDQDPKTGHLTLVKYHNVDTSKVNGLWITCGASLSPWELTCRVKNMNQMQTMLLEAIYQYLAKTYLATVQKVILTTTVTYQKLL